MIKMKSKYVLLIVLVILMQYATALTIFYPPQATHNWQQGDSAGTFSTSITDVRIYLTSVVSGSRNYVVTDQINLTNISLLSVDWKGNFDALIGGNITFGFASVQGDDSFVNFTSYQTTFARTIEYIDVSSYYGLYYLKFGINVTSGFPAIISGWLYGVEGFNFTYAYPLNASDVEETTANIHGYLQEDANYSCTCGFWVYNQTTNASNAINITAPGTYHTGDVFSVPLTSSYINSSTYYYVRTWSQGVVGFNISTNETYFLTKPNQPFFLDATPVGPRSLSLNWTNATMGNNNNTLTNQSVYIQYQTGSPPTTRSEGTFACNESKYNNFTVHNLQEETEYYFSAWTYINSSGSPYIIKWSDSYKAASNTTAGGIYNITVRYENESTSGNIPVDLTKYGPHRLKVHYDTRVDYVVFYGGTVSDSTVYGFWSNIANGNFTVIGNETVKFFELTWNYTDNRSFRCHRIIIPTAATATTFYIRTNMPIYGISTGYMNESLVEYTYTFKDPSAIFVDAPELDAYADIYTYNSSNVRLTIHKEFFSANDEVEPMLIGCKKYFIGVGSSALVIDRIGIAPTGCAETSDISPNPINIPQVINITYAFFEVININQGWRGDQINGFYVYYQDTMFGTNFVNFTVWDYNGTIVYWENSTSDIKNFTYPLACKKFKYNYTIRVSHTVWTENHTIGGTLYPGMTHVTDVISLDDLMNKTLGQTPFQNFEKEGVEVPWSTAVVGIIGIIMAFSFGAINGYLGAMSTGAWFCIAPIIISGVPGVFFAGGIFLISMAFIFAYGGRN